jgi:hypothetical protein
MSELATTNGQLDPMTIAKVFRSSGMFPDIQSEAAAATKIIIGRGLGLTDYDAMSGLHIIKGKAVLAANLMAAAIKRSGKYDYRVVEHTDAVCTIDFYGGGVKIGSTSFSIEDAKRAGLGGDNWRKYARAMLFARCISMGYRTHCPDALGAAPVYVEAHGETEIPDDPPAKPAAPAAPAKPARQMTREERRADTEALLSPTPKALPAAAEPEIPIDGGSDRVAIEPPNSVTLTPKSTKIAKIPNSAWWRVDVDHDEKPYAVNQTAIADAIEASLAFNATVLAFYEMAGTKRVIVKLEEVGHG